VQNSSCCQQQGARETGREGDVGKEIGRDGGSRERWRKEGREKEGREEGRVSE